MELLYWILIICLVLSWTIFWGYKEIKWTPNRMECKIRRYFQHEGYFYEKVEGVLWFRCCDWKYKIHLFKNDDLTSVVVSLPIRDEDFEKLDDASKLYISYKINYDINFSKVYISHKGYQIATIWDITSTSLQTSFPLLIRRINNIINTINEYIEKETKEEEEKKIPINSQEEITPIQNQIIGEC